MFVDELRDIKWLESLPLALDIYFEDITEMATEESAAEPILSQKPDVGHNEGNDVY